MCLTTLTDKRAAQWAYLDVLVHQCSLPFRIILIHSSTQILTHFCLHSHSSFTFSVCHGFMALYSTWNVISLSFVFYISQWAWLGVFHGNERTIFGYTQHIEQPIEQRKDVCIFSFDTFLSASLNKWWCSFMRMIGQQQSAGMNSIFVFVQINWRVLNFYQLIDNIFIRVFHGIEPIATK